MTELFLCHVTDVVCGGEGEGKLNGTADPCSCIGWKPLLLKSKSCVLEVGVVKYKLIVILLSGSSTFSKLQLETRRKWYLKKIWGVQCLSSFLRDTGYLVNLWKGSFHVKHLFHRFQVHWRDSWQMYEDVNGMRDCEERRAGDESFLHLLWCCSCREFCCLK